MILAGLCPKVSAVAPVIPTPVATDRIELLDTGLPKLANNYASEEYWGAKSLLLMARNYIGLKDNYQASYTVDQIINNYQDFPEIVAEAKEIKKTIR